MTVLFLFLSRGPSPLCHCLTSHTTERRLFHGSLLVADIGLGLKRLIDSFHQQHEVISESG